jgi:hypothetical protein
MRGAGAFIRKVAAVVDTDVIYQRLEERGKKSVLPPFDGGV